MQIAVLGCGMVGRAIAIDLVKNHTVTAFDISTGSLDILSKKNNAVRTVTADLSDYKKYPELLNSFDLVVTAVPGFMGYKALEAVIKSKKM